MIKEIEVVRPEVLKSIGSLNAVLIGMPASGKTTFVENLRSVTDVRYVSLGAITRAELAKETALSGQLKQLFETNQPWPDDFVMSILEPHILESCGQGFLLDGVPKKRTEAVALKKWFKSHGVRLDAVLTLEVDRGRAIDRISSRNNDGRMEQVAHYQTRFTRWEEDRGEILNELGQLTPHIKCIDTNNLPIEGVLSEGINFLADCVMGS